MMSRAARPRVVRELELAGRQAAKVLVDSHASVAPGEPVASSSEMAAAIDQVCAKMNKCIAADMGVPLPTKANFDQAANSPRYRHWSQGTGGTSPVLVTELYSDPLLTLIVFCLRDSSCRIPLHDHVGMHGFMRVLRGQIRVTSYSWPAGAQQYASAVNQVRQMYPGEPDCLLPAYFHSSQLRSPSDATLVLRPLEANVHEVSVEPDGSGGPAVFLDLLTPSYEQTTRDCTYYQPVLTARPAAPVVAASDLQPGDRVFLRPVVEPPSFWTLPWPRAVSGSSR